MMFKSTQRREYDNALISYSHFYKRSLFMSGNVVLTMLRSINSISRDDKFVDVEPNFSKMVPDLMMDLARIQGNELSKTRMYPIRKYFITTFSDQITDDDFLLNDEWDNSMFTSHSNMQVFYSSKNRYLMLNLMLLEPMLLNRGFLRYASQ